MLASFRIFGHDISLYGVTALIGIALAILLTAVRSRRYRLPPSDILYAYLYGLIGLFVGAKLLYLIASAPLIINNWSRFLEEPELFLLLFTGGFVYYGGLLGAIFGAWLYCKIYKLDSLKLLDCAAPAIPLAHAFGRLGCLLAGCCYGTHYNGPFAITFPEGVPAPACTPLFPSQPLEAIANVFLCVTLMLISRIKQRDGALIAYYLIAYAIIRFILEFYRGDIERGVLAGLSTSQWFSILICLPAVYLLLRRRPNTTAP